MGYKKNKIEAQKGQSHGSAMVAVAEAASLIRGIPTPVIVHGKIQNLAEFIEKTLKTIRDYLLLRYNLGSDVHEVAVMRFVNALQRWHIARDALERDGDYLETKTGFEMHPAHRVIQMAEKTMSQFEMDFGLLPRQAFTRAEASSAGGTESRETDNWSHMASFLNEAKPQAVVQ